MKLFKEKSPNNAQQPGMILRGLQVVYKHAQTRWAVWMSGRTNQFSRRTWVTLLILFVLSGGVCCIYIAASSFRYGDKRTLSITPINKPKHVIKMGEATVISTKLPEKEYNRIKQFRLYMDSLARSPGGKEIYDSIIANRPGLMDSVRFIENYYQQ